MVHLVRRPRYPVVLASGSPRRRELLKDIVATFDVAVSEIDEESGTGSDPWETAQTLAQHKAEAVFARFPNSLVVGSDTVVAANSETGDGEWVQFAKPRDADDSVAMLRSLSGRRHVVLTGVCLIWPGGKDVFVETSWVTFRKLAESEMLEYAATPEPYDKAGGYAIQGLAQSFVIGLEGSLRNVVGLPVEALDRRLTELGLWQE